MLNQMLTEDEKKDPENGERVINVLKWMANAEEEEKAGDLKTHFIREEVFSLDSLRPKSKSDNTLVSDSLMSRFSIYKCSVSGWFKYYLLSRIALIGSIYQD